MLLSPWYFSIPRSSRPAVLAVGSNDHVIAFASDRCFGLVVTGQCGMEKDKTVGQHHDRYDFFP